MKSAAKVIFLFRGKDGFGPAISDALQPNPNSPLQRTESKFDLSLERYGIKDHKASGNIINFLDPQGSPQVSVFLLQNYEPPIVVCAVNEVLASIIAEKSSDVPTFILPFSVESSKVMKPTLAVQKVSVCGAQLGPTTEFTKALLAGMQKLPPSLQISSEPLACLLQLVRVLKLPTVLLAGSSGHRQTKRTNVQELEVLFEIGELLASCVGLHFAKDRVHQNPAEKSKEAQEPWRALYG
ncbi:period circadian protein [Tasmannia lanceolata]|uniref:period circadian protein n=1 Tax=Tasmannia lanceolata TaxID=3420 RepID=UPI004062A701